MISQGWQGLRAPKIRTMAPPTVARTASSSSCKAAFSIGKTSAPPICPSAHVPQQCVDGESDPSGARREIPPRLWWLTPRGLPAAFPAAERVPDRYSARVHTGLRQWTPNGSSTRRSADTTAALTTGLRSAKAFLNATRESFTPNSPKLMAAEVFTAGILSL